MNNFLVEFSFVFVPTDKFFEEKTICWLSTVEASKNKLALARLGSNPNRKKPKWTFSWVFDAIN